jgi:hypothetical protein
MGSLSSRPSVPSPQVVYLPQTTSTPSSTTAATTTSTSTSTDSSADTTTASQAREESLLSRSRGRAGTILTSFRGLLGAATDTTMRKTLLGE